MLIKGKGSSINTGRSMNPVAYAIFEPLQQLCITTRDSVCFAAWVQTIKVHVLIKKRLDLKVNVFFFQIRQRKSSRTLKLGEPSGDSRPSQVKHEPRTKTTTGISIYIYKMAVP